MTDSVSPSIGHSGDSYQIADAIDHGGATKGPIADGGTVYLADHAGLSGTPLNGFAASTSTTSLDVTIDTGEAFVEGAWMGRDTTTTVTLNSSTADQTVYAGWNGEAGDTVIIGLASDSAWPASGYYGRIPIYDFDTDGSGVTSTTDRRVLEEGINPRYETDDGTGVAVDEAQSTQTFGGAAASSYARSDQDDDIDGLRTYIERGSRVAGSLSDGEAARWASGTSDLVLSLQGGFGRVAYGWNAYWDNTNSTWRYIVGSEQAQQITMKSGELILRSAPGANADDPITWDETTFTAGEVHDFALETRSDRPSSPQVGRMIYRSDKD